MRRATWPAKTTRRLLLLLHADGPNYFTNSFEPGTLTWTTTPYGFHRRSADF
jgi:hypothetical protein